MADEHAETGEHGTEGADQANGDALPTRDELHARDRAAFLADAGDDTEAEAEQPKPTKKSPVLDEDDDDLDDGDDADDDLDEVAATDDDDLDDDDADDLDDADDDDDDDADALAAKAKADPELKKRLDAVRRTEQRSRQQLARDRAAFDAERTAWQAQSKSLHEAHENFQKLSARAKYDPASVLLALGISEDDLEHAGKQVYARSKASTVKPEHRDAADREARSRELADELAATKKRQDELESKLTEQARTAAADSQIDLMLRRAAKVAAATEDAPLTKQFLASNPKKARAELERVAARLAQKHGALPKPAMVVAAHEKQRRRELADLGVKVEAAAPKAVAAKQPIKAPIVAKPAPKAAAATETAPTRINGVGIKLPSKEELLSEDWSDAS